jgi:hypothetical protein
MAKRLKYTKRARYIPETRRERELDRKAHILLTNAHHPPTPLGPGAMRAVGSVLFDGGVWFSIGRDGEIIGKHATRWEAWREADKLGVEPIWPSKEKEVADGTHRR